MGCLALQPVHLNGWSEQKLSLTLPPESQTMPTDILPFRIGKPHCQRVANPVVEYFYLLHSVSPSLIVSVG